MPEFAALTEDEFRKLCEFLYRRTGMIFTEAKRYYVERRVVERMPVQDGLHLAAELRKVSPQMPIAIISANHQQTVVNRTTSLGATFLPKPLAEQALSEFLRKATLELRSNES